ncbi:MAG TPA: proliferating cell nuclear antigen (pcna) [Candidatus Nanoarchaeia archaeon]|nr:proliferating cell nuclear antigen (pcna) [Candidatus Nanoarchaeia archaeon]
MKLVLAEPKLLRESVTIISDLVNEATFKIDSNGMEMVAMDPANVAMVIFKLLSSSFAEYDVSKPVDISVNLANMKQILRRAGPSDMLSLGLDEKSNKLTITLKGGTTRTFSLPLISLEDKKQKVPELSFGVTVKTSSDILTQAIEDADIVGESVMFSITDQVFSIRAEGELSNANIDIADDATTKITSHDKGKVMKAKYSIEYLKKMIQGAKLCNEVMVHFNNDYPLRLDYKTTDRLMLSFILAPRVEND